MKKVTYISPNTKEKIDAFLISNIKELDEYNDYCEKAVDSFINQILTRDLEKEPQDIIPDCGQLRGVWKYTLFKSESEGTNPLLMLPWKYQEKYENMLSVIADKKHLLINMNGGYEFTNTLPQIIKSENVENLFLEENTKLNEGSSYIVLENDMEVDPEGHKIASLMDKDYSHITCLSKHSEDDLVSVFKKFKEMGGKGIYVYTTGQDINGMYRYTNAAIRAKFTEIKIDFNSGLNDDIKDYIEKFKSDIDIVYCNLKGKVNNKRVRP